MTSVLAEIEASSIRDLPMEGVASVVAAHSEKYLPMNTLAELKEKEPGLTATAISQMLDAERKKDHISHFIVRLAFCRS